MVDINNLKGSFFVSGASGFIGELLVKQLSSYGFEVRCLYRGTIPEGLKKIKNLYFFNGDIRNAEAMIKALEGIDYVFHMAAHAKIWSKDPNIPYEINVLGTKNLLDAALINNCKKFVFTSTAGTFGPSLNKQIVNEETKREIPFFTDYEATKAQANQLVIDYAKNGLDACIVSPTRVFGPGALNQSNSVSILLKKYSAGTFRFLPGNGSGIGNYIFVEDVVKGHLLAMQKGASGENYLLGAYNLSYSDFFNQWGKSFGKERKMLGFPIFGLLAFGKINDWYVECFNKAPLITTPWLKRYMFDWRVSHEKATNALGFSPTPIEIAFEKTKTWLLGNKN